MTTVTRALPRMGSFLDPGEEENVEIPFKKKVEVPLWYLEQIINGGEEVIPYM